MTMMGILYMVEGMVFRRGTGDSDAGDGLNIRSAEGCNMVRGLWKLERLYRACVREHDVN